MAGIKKAEMNITEAKYKIKRVLSHIPAVTGIGIYITSKGHPPELVINVDREESTIERRVVKNINELIDQEVQKDASLKEVKYTIQILDEVKFQGSHFL